MRSERRDSGNGKRNSGAAVQIAKSSCESGGLLSLSHNDTSRRKWEGSLESNREEKITDCFRENKGSTKKWDE